MRGEESLNGSMSRAMAGLSLVFGPQYGIGAAGKHRR
jgi:hypothetical protein